MSRSNKTHSRLPSPDPMYNNRLLGRFINSVMKDGKKSIAQSLVYKALDSIKAKNLDPVKTFEAAIKNVGPRVEVRARRVGGASYQVPTEVRGDRRVSLAIRWIMEAAHKRSSREFTSFDKKLSQELLDAADNKGDAIRKRDVVHKVAESNRAFSHFKW